MNKGLICQHPQQLSHDKTAAELHDSFVSNGNAMAAGATTFRVGDTRRTFAKRPTPLQQLQQSSLSSNPPDVVAETPTTPQPQPFFETYHPQDRKFSRPVEVDRVIVTAAPYYCDGHHVMPHYNESPRRAACTRQHPARVTSSRSSRSSEMIKWLANRRVKGVTVALLLAVISLISSGIAIFLTLNKSDCMQSCAVANRFNAIQGQGWPNPSRAPEKVSKTLLPDKASITDVIYQQVTVQQEKTTTPSSVRHMSNVLRFNYNVTLSKGLILGWNKNSNSHMELENDNNFKFKSAGVYYFRVQVAFEHQSTCNNQAPQQHYVKITKVRSGIVLNQVLQEFTCLGTKGKIYGTIQTQEMMEMTKNSRVQVKVGINDDIVKRIARQYTKVEIVRIA